MHPKIKQAIDKAKDKTKQAINNTVDKFCVRILQSDESRAKRLVSTAYPGRNMSKNPIRKKKEDQEQAPTPEKLMAMCAMAASSYIYVKALFF